MAFPIARHLKRLLVTVITKAPISPSAFYGSLPNLHVVKERLIYLPKM